MKARNWSRLLAGRGKTDRQSIAVLDCCAAPGSKTALIARRNPRAKVFATELHPHRARLLQNLSRLPNVHVVAADARHLPFLRSPSTASLPTFLVPAPALWPAIRRSSGGSKLEDLCDLHSRQVAILKSALAQLAIGGRLVYSTCSLEREENEAVVEAALDGTCGIQARGLQEELEKLRPVRRNMLEGYCVASRGTLPANDSRRASL